MTSFAVNDELDTTLSMMLKIEDECMTPISLFAPDIPKNAGHIQRSNDVTPQEQVLDHHDQPDDATLNLRTQSCYFKEHHGLTS